MKNEIFNQESLPITEFEKYGLAKNGRILMDSQDVQAILEGRRSDMIRIFNVSENGKTIKEIDLKVSVAQNQEGKLSLVFHPIYKEATYPKFLTDVEAEKLQNGETVSITKKILDDQTSQRKLLLNLIRQQRSLCLLIQKKFQFLI